MPHKTLEARRAWRKRTREHHNAYARAYRQSHPKVVEDDRAYKQANKVRANALRKARRLANPEQARERDRANWEANKGNRRDKRKLHRARNRERLNAQSRMQYRLNPLPALLAQANRRARKLALPSTFTANEQRFCRAYFNYACAACGNEEGFEWTIGMDHWIPISSPECPGTIAANMIPLCHGLGSCNTSKHNLAPDVWLVRRFGKRQARQILKKIHAYFALFA